VTTSTPSATRSCAAISSAISALGRRRSRRCRWGRGRPPWRNVGHLRQREFRQRRLPPRPRRSATAKVLRGRRSRSPDGRDPAQPRPLAGRRPT
jgi:hypothetical protein